MQDPELRPPIALIPIAMLLTICAIAFARVSYGLLLPSMAEDLNLSLKQSGFLGTATSLGYIVFLLPAAALATRHGPRLSILSGLLILSFGFALLGWVQSYFGISLVMALLGVGTAFVFTPVIALMVAWHPSKRGLAIGAANSGIGLGILLCGVFVPLAIGYFGVQFWRNIWQIFAVVAMLTLALSYRLVHNPPQRGSARGQGLAAWHEAVQSPGLRLLALIYGLLGSSYIVQAVFAYSFAVNSGLSKAFAGSLLGASGLALIIGSPLGGLVSDRVGRALTLLFGFVATALVIVLPAIWPSAWAFSVHFIGFGFLLPFLFSAILAGSSEHVSPHLAAIAISIITFVFALGQLIGPAAAGAWIEWRGEFRSCFVILATLMMLGSALAMRLRVLERKLVS